MLKIMEQNKYFTPNIEDMRVGYECEANPKFYSEQEDVWSPIIMKGIGQEVIHYHSLGVYRTPYLTKEQIEAEGWKPANTGGLERGCMNGRCAFTKGNYFLIIPSEPNTKLGDRIEIVMADVLKDEYHEWTSNGRMYIGQCKDINTFRYICKLLGI